MSLKRSLAESGVRLMALGTPRLPQVPTDPQSIFVLRNNDIGDLLVATPLFAALKRQFPKGRIVAGVGSWNIELLQNNPYVDEVLPLNAPWHNQRFPASGVLSPLRYLLGSAEVKEIRRRRFDIGIDFLGSPYGSLLLMHALIPWRLGVKGYAGGHSGVQQCVQFDPANHVCKAGLQFATLLGARDLPEPRPQLFLTAAEVLAGAERWGEGGDRPRVVVAPGGGYSAKCWPIECYSALLKRIQGASIAAVGGEKDRAMANSICESIPQVRNFAGRLGLRELFGLIAAADVVICNSSMAMHVAAAFKKPSLVLLGESFPSAREHSRLWGYSETCMMGPEPEHPVSSSVDEAYAAYLGLVSKGL